MGMSDPAEPGRALPRNAADRRRRRGTATAIYVLVVFAVTIAVFYFILGQSTNLARNQTAVAYLVDTTRHLARTTAKLEGQLMLTDAILAQSALGETDSAIALAERAAQADPKGARFPAIAADLRLRRGTPADVQAAQSDVRRAQAADPRSPLVQSVSARLNASSSATVRKAISDAGQRSASELATAVAKETTASRDSLRKKPGRAPANIRLRDIEFLPQPATRSRVRIP